MLNSINSLGNIIKYTSSSKPIIITQSYSGVNISSKGYFAGNNNVIYATLTNTFGTGDFTSECWFYPTNNTITNQGLIGFGPYNSGSQTNGRLTIYWNHTNKPNAITLNDASGNQFFSSYSTLSINTWYHLAICRVSGIITIYINGVADGSVNWATNYNFTNKRFTLGRDYYDAPQDYYYGYIAVLKVSTYGFYIKNFTPSRQYWNSDSATILLLNMKSSSTIITDDSGLVTGSNISNAGVLWVGDNSVGSQFTTSFSFPNSITDATVNITSELATTSWAYGGGYKYANGTYNFSCSTFTAEKLNSGIDGYASAYGCFKKSTIDYWSGGQQSSLVFDYTNANVSSLYTQQPYNGSTGLYQGTGNSTTTFSTTIDGNAISGDWIQVSFPMSFKCSSIQMMTRSGYAGRFPANWYLAGSNDGTTWTSLLYINYPVPSTLSSANPNFITFPVNATVDYQYFRIVVHGLITQNGNNSNQTVLVDIGQINMIGDI